MIVSENTKVLGVIAVADTVKETTKEAIDKLKKRNINGRNSIGIDINPLASLISKTKITTINPKRLEEYTNHLFTV